DVEVPARVPGELPGPRAALRARRGGRRRGAPSPDRDRLSLPRRGAGPDRHAADVRLRSGRQHGGVPRSVPARGGGAVRAGRGRRAAVSAMAGLTLAQATTIVQTALAKARETGCAP